MSCQEFCSVVIWLSGATLAGGAIFFVLILLRLRALARRLEASLS